MNGGMNDISKKRYAWFMKHYDPDYVLEQYDGRDFLELVVSTGGDVTKYRVYGKDAQSFRCCCK